MHPGYGFLSENAGLAAACKEAGLIFVGPDAALLKLFGDKAEAKRHARAVGVPVLAEGDDARGSVSRRSRRIARGATRPRAKAAPGRDRRRAWRGARASGAVSPKAREKTREKAREARSSRRAKQVLLVAHCPDTLLERHARLP